MTVCGIVAEYNPFHNGHAYQLEKARELTGADTMIVVMSGNFTQRGEPAVINKWLRAESAVRNGADVVIELPYIYCVQAASRFASAAIRLLDLAGCHYVCFGSECGNLANLQEIADTPVNPDHLHVSLHEGMSFPRAYSLLTSDMEPNDILAVAYLKAMKDTDMKPVLVQRTSGYLSTDLSENASAFAIRNALFNGQSVHGMTPMEDILSSENLIEIKQYWPYLRTLLMASPRERLADLFLFNEGIEKLLKENACKETDYSSFLNACTNYRYTSSRIRRTCLSVMNQISKKEVGKLPVLDTLRILAFNEKGRLWLHNMRKTDVHIASKFADVPYPYREMEYRTSLVYSSVMNKKDADYVLQNEIRGAHYVH